MFDWKVGFSWPKKYSKQVVGRYACEKKSYTGCYHKGLWLEEYWS